MRNDLHPLAGAMPVLRREFGLELSLSDLAELGWTCLRLIGHEYRSTHATIVPVHVDMAGRQLAELPCNAREVVAVTAAPVLSDVLADPVGCGPRAVWGGPEWVVDQILSTPVWYLENYQPLLSYHQGEYRNFTLTDQGLLLTPQPGVAYTAAVWVLYKGYLAGSDGLPLITEADALAIAAYCNYVDHQRKLFSSQPNQFQAADDLKNRRIVQARVQPVSEAGMAEVLRVKTSYHRAHHADAGFKPREQGQRPTYRGLPSPRGSRW